MSRSTARYAIGIDLGTTHTALAYVDLTQSDQENISPCVFSIPQLVTSNSIEAHSLLPSFLYVPHSSESIAALPWAKEKSNVAVGEYARSRGVEAPIRLVSSAKSWLCHTRVDRRAAILPLLPAGTSSSVEDEITKFSPVEVSRRYLEHVRDAWDAHFAQSDVNHRFVNQEIVITVPASFDAAARELTAEAATQAGITHFTLLEEPQAALYAWIESTQGHWRKSLKVGDVLLVIDIGGGTTDFSAIVVQEREGSLELHRVAVGDHILLGGDNMDLALAHHVRQKISATGKELDAWQMQSLIHAVRKAKEQLLSHDANTTQIPIVIAGRGSKLFGSSIRTELTHDEVTKNLIDGFFPIVEASARPMAKPRTALTQLGLNYASDPAITRHLAAFLSRHVSATTQLSESPHGTSTLLRPTALLFNGGVTKSKALCERIVTTLNQWLSHESANPIRALEDADLDLAVAKGAAYYGCVKQGRGVRIRGGTARSYYVGIETSMPAIPGLEPPVHALCVAPFGMEEGSSAALPPQELGAVVGEPVRFRFFSSTTRRNDNVGQMLERWPEGELEEMPAIEVTLPAGTFTAGDVVPVYLNASVTEVGTLLLEAVDASEKSQQQPERWKIELNVRG